MRSWRSENREMQEGTLMTSTMKGSSKEILFNLKANKTWCVPFRVPLSLSHTHKTHSTFTLTVFQILNDDDIHNQLCPSRRRRLQSLLIMVHTRTTYSTPSRILSTQQLITPTTSSS